MNKTKKPDASSPEEQVVSSVVAHTPVKVEKQEGAPSTHQLGADHFLKYKWLRKRNDRHLVCIVCTHFPEVSKATDVFVRGWVGNANGLRTKFSIGTYENRTTQDATNNFRTALAS